MLMLCPSDPLGWFPPDLRQLPHRHVLSRSELCQGLEGSLCSPRGPLSVPPSPALCPVHLPPWFPQLWASSPGIQRSTGLLGFPFLCAALRTLSRQVAGDNPWAHVVCFLFSYITKLRLLMPTSGKLASYILIIVAVIDVAIAVSVWKVDLGPQV